MKNWSCVCYNNLLSSRLNSISPTLTKPISPRPREGLRINQPGIFYRLLFHFEQRSACVCMCVRARMCECVFTHVRFAKGPSSARFRASAATSTFSTTRVGGFPRSSASSTLSAFLFFPSFLFSFLTLQTNARFSKRSIFGRCMVVPATRGKISESALASWFPWELLRGTSQKFALFRWKATCRKRKRTGENSRGRETRGGLLTCRNGWNVDVFRDFSQVRRKTMRDFVSSTPKTSSLILRLRCEHAYVIPEWLRNPRV